MVTQVPEAAVMGRNGAQIRAGRDRHVSSRKELHMFEAHAQILASTPVPASVLGNRARAVENKDHPLCVA